MTHPRAPSSRTPPVDHRTVAEQLTPSGLGSTLLPGELRAKRQGGLEITPATVAVAGKATSMRPTQLSLARLERSDPTLHCVVTLTADRARRQVRAGLVSVTVGTETLGTGRGARVPAATE